MLEKGFTMASKKSASSRSSSSKKSAPKATGTSTAVRHSAIPKVEAAPAPRMEITEEMIARRAYEIWQSGVGGNEFENWVRAETELRAA